MRRGFGTCLFDSLVHGQHAEGEILGRDSLYQDLMLLDAVFPAEMAQMSK